VLNSVWETADYADFAECGSKLRSIQEFLNFIRKMRWLLLQIAAFFLVSNLGAAEPLLVMQVFARLVPTGQAEPIPDPFIEPVSRGEAPAITEGIQELQGKSFQISLKFEDFAPVTAGLEGQQVSVRFTAATLANGACTVTHFQAFALARASRSQAVPVGSSVLVSGSGFTIAPGQRISQSVTAQSDGGRVIYYLIFSAAKGVAG
jgi:hypothetical protein